MTLRGEAMEGQLRLGYTGFVALGGGWGVTLFSGVNRVWWDDSGEGRGGRGSILGVGEFGVAWGGWGREGEGGDAGVCEGEGYLGGWWVGWG